MTSRVYYGSPFQVRIGAEETLPAKLDRILEELNLRASHRVVPNLTLWVDCPVEVGLGRVKQRAGGAGDRFEIEPAEFHARVRAGFAALAARFPERIVRIDGDRGEDEVAAACIDQVQQRMTAKSGTGTGGRTEERLDLAARRLAARPDFGRERS